MTSKERILTTLKFGETDRLCFSPLADGYFVAGLPKQGFQYDLIQALDYRKGGNEGSQRALRNPLHHARGTYKQLFLF